MTFKLWSEKLNGGEGQVELMVNCKPKNMPHFSS